MLGKNKFDQSKASNNNQLSVILKRPQQVHVNLIRNQPMQESLNLCENVMPCCEFEVQDSGYYHISSQVTIKNVSSKPAHVEYLQFGICRSSMEDYNDLLKSSVMNSNCHPEYVVADTLCSIVHLSKEVKYNMWINFGSEHSKSFQFQAEYSNLRLYKL